MPAVCGISEATRLARLSEASANGYLRSCSSQHIDSLIQSRKANPFREDAGTYAEIADIFGSRLVGSLERDSSQWEVRRERSWRRGRPFSQDPIVAKMG